MCKEYKDIDAEYKRTNGKGHIQRIERIQNFPLWKRFHNQQLQINHKLQKALNRDSEIKLLWHGT